MQGIFSHSPQTVYEYNSRISKGFANNFLHHIKKRVASPNVQYSLPVLFTYGKLSSAIKDGTHGDLMYSWTPIKQPPPVSQPVIKPPIRIHLLFFCLQPAPISCIHVFSNLQQFLFIRDHYLFSEGGRLIGVELY